MFHRFSLVGVVATLTLIIGGCSSDNSSSTTAPTARTYDQVQRLGNPLISEVLLAKRSHEVHGALGPQDDSIITPEIANFIETVAGRDQTVVTTLASVLLPDMLIVQTDKDPTTAGWLSWALAAGYGGRKLQDDVVDDALDAVFGTLIETAGNSCPQLCTDNVGPHTDYSTSFPYLGTPN